MIVIVLNDGETYTCANDCRIVEADDPAPDGERFVLVIPSRLRLKRDEGTYTLIRSVGVILDEAVTT